MDHQFDQMKRNLPILWIGVFLAAMSFSLVMPFLPTFIESLGVHDNLYVWSGWTYAITFLASAIMSPIWGNLADRYGRKPMIIRSGVSIGIIYILMSMVTNPFQLFALRALNGALSGFIPSAITLIATNTPEERVGRSLATMQTGTATGTILGPMLGGTLADLVGIRTSMEIAGLLIFVATALVFFGVKEKVTGTGQNRTSPVQDLKLAVTNRTLLALMVATMLVNASIQSLEPILTKFVPTLRMEEFLLTLVKTAFGGSTDGSSFIAGFVFSLPAIATLIAARRWAGVGERIGFPKLLGLGLGAAGVLALPQALAKTAGTLILLRFAYGLMTASVFPSINATLAKVVHPSFRGRAFGINQSAMQVGSVLGPTLGGYVADGIGPKAVFIWTGLLLLVSSVWVHRELATRVGKEAPVGTPQEAV